MGRRPQASRAPTPAIVRARALVTRWGQPTPFFIQTLTEHTLFTNSEQSRQGPSHTKFTSQGPPPSLVLQPPALGWGREVSSTQGTRWEPGTHQQEQHIAGDGHVERLKLVDGCKGCHFHKGVRVSVGAGGSRFRNPQAASSAPSPASSEDLRPRVPSAPALAPPRLGEAQGMGSI